LFLRIYQGEPVRRTDPVGTNELAVDASGGVYPSRLWMGNPAFRAGILEEGRLDEALLKRFDDVGAVTTPACMRCWARGLCGGGVAAVHHALSGNFRLPHAPWCDAQRAWLEAAVAAFNLLAARGVHFTRIYQNLGRAGRPSLFQLARAAFGARVGVRPLEEGDAELLTRWENWNEAAYFLCTESGMFMATRYDREMDSLYPRDYEREFMLLRKTGAPIGLMRVRPDRIPRTARAWLYLRDQADYADRSVHRGLRHILEEAAKQTAEGGLRRITVPVSPSEDALAGFLDALGFQREGVEREALYLHGRYHDVRIYALNLDTP
ncbi:MAG TPA: GNAT family N-acetyltransferase, partial [Candidatus Hydrogenedentes bacterium]|nr:GNAT family N-acetyltransferase [Candidatus Hydrogenedentota bacterium]